MIIWGMGFRDKDHRGRVQFSSHHIKGPCHEQDITEDVKLNQMAEVVSPLENKPEVGFFIVKLFFFLIFVLYSLEGSHYAKFIV